MHRLQRIPMSTTQADRTAIRRTSLSRKELFVAEDYPTLARFARLTACDEKIGLLDATSTINTKNGWHGKLARHGVSIRRHRIVRAA